MYFSYKHNNYCVNCDWLSYSVHLKEAEPEFICPDGFRIELCQGNNIFEHRALIYDNRGAKYMTLLWKPFSKVLPSNVMTAQVANEFLYTPNGSGIQDSFTTLQSIIECTFNSVSRLDICIDFEGNKNRHGMIKKINDNALYVQAKSEGSSWWHEVSKGSGVKKQLHCLTWGSAKSEIKVKLYHKSREQGLLENADASKPWIVEQWKEIGMDITNVWRLEFSLNGAGQLRWENQPITLDMVCNVEWLFNVCCQLYDTRFIIRKNEGKRQGHKNNDPRVYLFPFPTRPAGLQWAEPQGKDYELPAAITLLRAMMRQIDNPAVMAAKPTFEDYAGTIINLIRDHHLEGYFRRTYDTTSDDYFNDLYNNVGGGLRKTTPSPTRLMD